VVTSTGPAVGAASLGVELVPLEHAVRRSAASPKEVHREARARTIDAYDARQSWRVNVIEWITP
jgi:hypothetical protein